MPVVGRPGQHAVPRRPDGAVGKALLSQGSRQVLQMPRERSQPLVQEIPLAFRQTPATVLPVASPLLQDHDVVQSLHFYFLLARTPLSEVEVCHLTSPTRLAFGSAPIPKLPTKRPRQQPPTSLAALVSCLQRCRPILPWRLRGLRPLLPQVTSQGEDPITSNTTNRMGGDPRTPVGFRGWCWF